MLMSHHLDIVIQSGDIIVALLKLTREHEACQSVELPLLIDLLSPGFEGDLVEIADCKLSCLRCHLEL